MTYEITVLPDGRGVLLTLEDGLSFEATGITQRGSIVKATISAMDRSTNTIFHRDGPMTLTSASRRRAFLASVGTVRATALPPDDDPLLALEAAIRQVGLGTDDRRRATGGPSGKPFEHSNTQAQVEMTPALAALLATSHLFEHLSNTLRRWGWVGNRRPPVLAYLAVLSRLLPRPMNVAFVSQAASGKNKAIDAALALAPDDAYYLMRAGSDRALIYADVDFQHRAVIFGEADSIPDEGSAASAIRSLASDNILVYDVTEQNPTTNRFETRRIEKPGPTGLITTSTKTLAHQLNTRILEVAVPDDEAQTRLIMRAQARRVSDEPITVVETEPWITFQRWLMATGPHRVVVPFADALATLVPAKAVRMRRDFPQLLTCIQSLALLFLRQRPRTADGAIVAALADYRRARVLLAPTFDSVSMNGISAAVRETVEAVPAGVELSQAHLAAKLKLERSTLSWRVARALKGGWLKNLETRKGRPARLVLGDPMPDRVTALPTSHAVREVFERCSSGVRMGPNPVTDTPVESNGEVFECSNGFPGEPPPSKIDAATLVDVSACPYCGSELCETDHGERF